MNLILSYVQKHGVWISLVTTIAVVYLVGFLGLLGDWWFEDDTVHAHYVLQHSNPFAYFFDREAIKAFTMGRVFTPLLALSFWVDMLLFQKQSWFAYLHQVSVAVLVVGLIFLTLSQWVDNGLAAGGALLWMLLPSTICVFEFLATRHYLEGLAFSLFAVLSAHQANALKNLKRWIFLACLFCFLAALCKEIYVTSTFLLIAVMFVWNRHWSALLAVMVTGGIYAGFRILMIGLGPQGLGDLQATREYFPEFLQSVPFLFTGSNWGYIVLPFFFVLALLVSLTGRLSWRWFLAWALNLAIILMTLFPVSHQLYASRMQLGTWYRVAFLLNSFLLFSCLWTWHLVFQDLKSKWVRSMSSIVFFLGCLLAFWPGGSATRDAWDGRKEAYFKDATFYLENPDKLLYSRLPAPWFLVGVHQLYCPERDPHFITWRMFYRGVLERLDSYPYVWEASEGTYRINPELHRLIFLNTLDGTLPLDRPRPQSGDP